MEINIFIVIIIAIICFFVGWYLGVKDKEKANKLRELKLEKLKLENEQFRIKNETNK